MADVLFMPRVQRRHILGAVTHVIVRLVNGERPGRLQVPHYAAIRIELDTFQVLDDMGIPHGKWGAPSYLEPLTKDFFKFGPGGGRRRPLRTERFVLKGSSTSVQDGYCVREVRDHGC